jgi:hypothetical protein
MWTFKYGALTIEAKIVDIYWLQLFQKGEVDLGPGDSLRVTLYEEVSYGFDNEVVHTEYEVRKVHGVVRGPKGSQIGLIRD